MATALAPIKIIGQPSIEDLAVRARSGEPECFDEIVRRLRPKLRRFLAGRVGAEADADDLVQETFVKALDNLERYDPSYRFSTWLFTIGANLAVSHHRRRRPVSSVDAEHSDSGDAETEIIDRDAGAHLWRRARAVLKPACYEVLWLRYGEDLEPAEIARRTGRTAIHIRVLLYRARRRLAQEEL